MSWIDSLRGSTPGTATAHGRKARRLAQRALKLEALEDRTLLTTYTIVELSPEGGRRDYGYAVSDTNFSTGDSNVQGIRFFKASLWDATGDRLSTFVIGNNKISSGKDINNSNRVAGASNYNANPSLFHAYKTDAAGGMIDLGVLPGSNGNSYAEGINDVNTSGDVVGYSNYSGGGDKFHAALWPNGGGAAIDIHAPWGGDTSKAYEINDAGTVVGSANDSSLEEPYPFVRTSGGGYTNLGLIPNFDDGGEAYAVNNGGFVVGGTYFIGGFNKTKIWHGFIWNPNTGLMTDLGNLGQGGDHSQAFDINDNGMVVGLANTTFGDSTRHAWVWDGSGPIEDLNGLVTNGGGWVLNSAEGINNAGWIVGWGTRNLQPRGFLLIPNESPAPGFSIDPALTTDVLGRSTDAQTIVVTPAVSSERTIQRLAVTSNTVETTNLTETRATVSTAQNVRVLPGPSATPEMLALELNALA